VEWTTKLKGAAAFLTGPWGAAIAVAGAGLMLWMQYTMNAKARVDELSASIDVTTGKLDELGQRTIVDTLVGEVDPAHWRYLDTLNLGLDEAMKAIQGTESEMLSYVDSVNAATKALEKEGITAGVVTNNIYDWWKATSRATDEALLADKAITSMGGASADAAGDIATLGDEADDAAKKISPLNRALNGLNRAVSRQRAIIDFKKAIKESITKPSGEAARAVITDFDAAIKTFKDGGAAQSQFIVDNYKAVEDAIKRSNVDKDQRQKLLKPLEETRLEAEKVLTALNNIDGASVTANIIYTGGTPTAAYAPIRRAQGGAVWGSGTATSDSIPAMLSNGEYVLRAAAVRTLGLGTLNKLNHADKMTDPALLDRMAVGGTPTERAAGPLIGSIVVHNPAHDVDVERAVVRGMARAERIKKERG